MVKIASKLLLIFFTCTFLLGSSKFESELKKADQQIETASKDELLRLFHGLKNIYIQAIVENDNNLKIEVLKRLVKSSHELGIEADNYEKELFTLTKNKKPEPTISKQEKPVAKKIEPKKKPTITKKSSKNTSAKNRLVELIERDELLYLSFDDELEKKDIKSFQLRSKVNIKDVFDVKGILTKQYKVKAPEGLSYIRVAQYDKETIRVVVHRNDNKKAYYKLSENKLRIYYNQTVKKKSTKTVKPKLTHKISANKTIVIDAGHGGKDGGAVGYKKKVEKRAVLKIALEIGRELKKRGYKIYYTRTNDKFVKLRNRTKFANDKDADIFISVHANAAARKSQYMSHKGLETYFLSPARSDRSKNIAALENKSDIDEMDYFSKQTFLNVFNREKIIAANKLALDIQQGMLNNLRKSYKVTDGGVREAPFWVLVGAQMPSILIEVGYITNPTEAMRMFNISYQKKLAYGVANGIDSYFAKNN